jgi:hypothetical protein
MFFRLSKKTGLCLLLLFQQEVEMFVEAIRSRLYTGRKLLLPLLSVTNTVNVFARYEDASRSRASEACQALATASPWYKLLIRDCPRTTSPTSVM